MKITAHIANRQEYSQLKIVSMRLIRFIQTGYLLHLVTVFSLFMVFWFGDLIINDITFKTINWNLLIYSFCWGYFFTLIFFSQLDALSRYQNYKMAKDKIYEYGFDARLLRPFVYSRCQRDAIAVAARDLNYSGEWGKLNYQLGFRWYHVLPRLVIRQPRILFTIDYWNKTLFVKHYQSKYFLW